MLKKLLVLLVFAVFATGCSSISLPGDSFMQRESSNISDKKWTSFEEVKESFNYLKAKIDAGKKVTTDDLDYLGFGPNTKNATSDILYTDLEKFFSSGTSVDRARLPDDIRRCTDKKDWCFGLTKRITKEHRQGKESLFERITNKKETEVTGWEFKAIFAIERQKEEHVVVAAHIQSSDPNKSNNETSSDPREAIINKLGILSLFGM